MRVFFFWLTCRFNELRSYVNSAVWFSLTWFGVKLPLVTLPFVGRAVLAPVSGQWCDIRSTALVAAFARAKMLVSSRTDYGLEIVADVRFISPVISWPPESCTSPRTIGRALHDSACTATCKC